MSAAVGVGVGVGVVVAGLATFHPISPMARVSLAFQTIGLPVLDVGSIAPMVTPVRSSSFQWLAWCPSPWATPVDIGMSPRVRPGMVKPFGSKTPPS